MIFTLLTTLTIFALWAHAQANIPIHPITNSNKAKYFSDPYHVPYQNNQGIYISGTTHQYLECGTSLQPGCASSFPIKYHNDQAIKQAVNHSGATICGTAGIHPFQTVSDGKRSWDAVVTLHVQNTTTCKHISGWSVIVHAHPENASAVDLPPTSWVGDKVLVGSFSEDVDANYDGKYFRTPAGQLYLVYQKQHSKHPKRDGVVAWPMDNPTTKTPGSKPHFLLLPGEGLNSENYIDSDHFKLIETGNIRAIKNKFLMAYSVGAYDHSSYKLGIAYSDTFLPADGQHYRKVMKDNPHHLWKSQGPQEVYYLLQADEKQDGWHYVGDQVLAPGVPTVAQIGPNDGWVATFAGYHPGDTGSSTKKFAANHRRPYFVDLDVNVPANPSVKEASDAELQSWITPAKGRTDEQRRRLEH
ncbi:hypothetical protein NA57DRAFT_44952 [Rhizodiscina lignyota]|uniref:Uncharacterized protein n=1 Tax=Rhizodiscina lignyota TaxID=1504668 RepID=A0A9P4IAT1_9PEZI|nr:hypothetical protein NA57DRAFT_44952 [Rhizodiscina lignyota]